MPTDLDFVLYFNIAFFSMLGLGMLFGFMRGFKKSIWHFFVTLIFYAVFFLTINLVVNVVWGMNLPFLGGLLANVMPSLSDATSLQEAVSIFLQDFLGVGYEDTLTSNFTDLVTSVGVFVVKIVYTILYFTVIQIIYRLIMWILRMIIFPSKKKTDKYKSKNRGLGAVFGLLTGAISLYVTLIVFGGMISISNSLLQVIPNPSPQPVAQIEMYNGFPNPNDTVLQAEPIIQIGLDNPQLLESIELITGMVEAYNTNIIVTTQNSITMPSEYTGNEMPLNLYLFDSVLSMTYQEEQIAIREELDIFAGIAGQLLESEYFETGDLADITGTEISNLFNGLATSNLITTILPIGIEVGTYYVETDLTIDVTDLYEIEWDQEISTLGQIAATAFDLVNAAGIFTDTTDLDTVTLVGEDVEDLFDSLGQSDLVTLAAYVAIEPLLENLGGTISEIITIPADISWANEFSAIGDLANEILSTNITIGEITAGDPTVLLGYLAEIDFTVIQNSEIISTAIINILSGQTSIDVSFLSVPDGLDWDTELENILLAVNALASMAGDIDIADFQNLTFDVIAELDLTAINAIFESEILVATVTRYLRELDLGDEFTIIIPDSALDDDLLYLKKIELQNIVSAADVIVQNMQCDDGDDACSELGFDITKMLALEEADIDTLLLPEILAATIGNLLIDLGSDILTIPGEALAEITVNTVPQDVVSREEITNAFLAISTLGISDIDDLETFDVSILNNLAVDPDAEDLVLDSTKASKLTASKVLRATLSKYLIDFAEPTDPTAEAMIVVPYLSETQDVIREIDSVDGSERISEAEIINILEAILVLDISDFTNFELDIADILENVSILLDSSILHATVSDQLMNLGDPIVVPDELIGGGDLKINVGSGETATTYIAKAELQAAFDALDALGITTDINDFTIDVTLLNNLAEDPEAETLVLDDQKRQDLFGSTIINATLSKFLINFAEPTDGSESLIVVPYIDEDNLTVRSTASDGTEYISELELTDILEAILALGLNDFNSFETLDIEEVLIPNLDTLLESSILHATISKQLIDLVGGEDSFIKVPVTRLNGDPLRFSKGDALADEDTEFISSDELKATFDSLVVLGVTDVNDVDIDVSILNNLAIDYYYFDNVDNILNMDDEIVYTYIGASYIDGDGSMYSINGTTGDFENSLSEVIIQDAYLFDTKADAEAVDLVLSVDKKDDLLGSTILVATLSYYLIDFSEPTDGSDPLIIIPYISEGDDVIRTTAADDTEFISTTELTDLLEAILALNISDFNNVETLNLETQLIPYLDMILDSAILHATISKQLIDQVGGEGSVVIVPANRLNGFDLRFVKGDPLLDEDTEYIASDEIRATFDALMVLDIGNIVTGIDIDVNILNNLAIDYYYLDASNNIVNMDDEIVYTYNSGSYIDDDGEIYTINGVTGDLEDSLSAVVLESTQLFNTKADAEAEALVIDDSKTDRLFSSTIINATLSKFILDQTTGVDPFLVVPEESQEFDTVRFIDSEDSTEFIHEDELTNLVEAVLALNLTDFGNVEGFDLDVIVDNKSVLLDSAILHASISKQLLDLVTSETVTIPEYFENETLLQLTRGDATLIHRTELENTFDALEVLGILQLNGANISMDILNDLAFEIYYKDGSNNLLNLDDEIIYTYDLGGFYTDSEDKIYTIDGVTGDLEDVLSTVKVYSRHIFDTKVDALDADKELDNINKSTILFGSTIIKATISKFIIDETVSSDPEVDPFLIVPYYDEDGGDLRNITIDGVNILVEQELEDILGAVIALDLANFNVEALSFTTIIDKKATILASSILQATISDQIIDIGTGLIEIPKKDEDNLIDIVKMPGDGLEETTYISFNELNKLLVSMELLGLGNINEFNGSTIDLNDLDGSESTFVDSAIIQATISKQVLNMVGDAEADTAVIVPYVTDLGDIRLRRTVLDIDDQNLELIKKTELVDLIEGFLALGFGNVTELSGTISLTTLATNATEIFESYIIQATVSQQVIDIGTSISIPYIDDDILGTRVRNIAVSVEESREYISKIELENLVQVLKLIDDNQAEPGDSVDFSGTIEFSIFFDPTNRGILLNSAIMHQTVSDQLSAISQVVVPEYSDDDSEEISFAVGVGSEETEYISTDELDRLFIALEILGGFSDIDDLDGTIDLGAVYRSNNPTGYDDAQNDLLDSRIMQATISNQIANIAGSIRIPEKRIASLSNPNEIIKITNLTSDNYISVSEIKNLFNALDVLGASDIGTFNASSIGFTALFSSDPDYLENRTMLLNSGIIHATLTDQIDTPTLTTDDKIIIPAIDMSDSDIKLYTTVTNDYFIDDSEIRDLLDGLEILGFTNGDLSTFGGVTNLTTVADNSSDLLESAILHATISGKLLGIDSDVLTVPMHTEVSETATDLIRVTKSSTEFIIKTEIEALLVALDDMGIGFDSTTIDTSLFFTNYNLYLQSSSIQATISKKLIEVNTNPLDPMFIFPEEDIRRDPDEVIYIEHTDVDYIELTELKALLAAIDILDLENQQFSSLNIDATSILGQTHATYVVVFDSAIMQATVSDRILENAKDEDTVTLSGQLIVPKAKRETITVDSVSAKWIENAELIYLVEALDIMGIDFSGSVAGNVFSTKTSSDIDNVLLSATMHITISYMIEDNDSIDVPNLALVGQSTSGSIYGVENVITATEIRNFIVAVNQIGGDINASIEFSAISTLNKAQRDEAVVSMIIRLKITPNLEAYKATLLETFDPTDYETGSVPQFLKLAITISTLDAIAGD